MKWAWAAVIATIVVAAGIFVVRQVTAPDSPATPNVGVQTITRTPDPVSTTTAEPADPATEVVTVVAVDRAGNPAAGYRVTAGEEVDSCLPSGTDTGVVSCAPAAAGASVCWVTPAPGVLLCGDEPWGKSLRRMTTAEPVSRTPSAGEAEPWGLELADGAKCQRRNGGAWDGRSDGLVGAYFCDREGEFVLAGDGPVVNRTEPAWTVKTGGLGAQDVSFPPPVDTRVVKAYFAASP
ncbi:hypothetical protein [Lentzea sp. CA-135723]|uniref:hypothetical protein n=1 Tax=Lentzea sp. CA-135723 TaxID=3239950 RepID=UPI003D8CB78A